MSHNHRNRFCLALIAAALLHLAGMSELAVQVQAQNPFGTAPATPAPATPAPAAGEPPPVEDNPIVLAVRDSNPTTPPQLLNAVAVMLDIGRLDEARNYFDQLVAMNLDQNQLAQLAASPGPAVFLRFARVPELLPEAQALSDQVFAAQKQAAEDPARVRALVNQLRDPATRRGALAGLKQARTAAFAPLLEVLADPAQQSDHRVVQSALVMLDDDAVAPLAAALQSGDPGLAMRVVEVLSAMRNPQAVSSLVRIAFVPQYAAEVREAALRALTAPLGQPPSASTAERFLRDEFLRDFQQLRTSNGNPAVVWEWDQDQVQAVARAVTAADAIRFRAVQNAAALKALAPENAVYGVWHVAALLERDQALVGDIAALPPTAGGGLESSIDAGPALTLSALAFCLESRRESGIIGAANVLAEIGTDEQLLSQNGRISPLAELQRPERSVCGSAGHHADQPHSTFCRQRPIPRDLVLPADVGCRPTGADRRHAPRRGPDAVRMAGRQGLAGRGGDQRPGRTALAGWQFGVSVRVDQRYHVGPGNE
jgi:hypothetical protein